MTLAAAIAERLERYRSARQFIDLAEKRATAGATTDADHFESRARGVLRGQTIEEIEQWQRLTDREWNARADAATWMERAMVGSAGAFAIGVLLALLAATLAGCGTAPTCSSQIPAASE